METNTTQKHDVQFTKTKSQSNTIWTLKDGSATFDAVSISIDHDDNLWKFDSIDNFPYIWTS